MSYILNIATAVPEFKIEEDDLTRFYAKAIANSTEGNFMQKLNLFNKKTKIDTRYSCISDFKGNAFELFTDGNFIQPIEKRMKLYEEKIVPLASKAVDAVLSQSKMKSQDFTHLLTVSCTGLMAPGLEFMIAEKYGLEHTEKSALNFLGCYAALKALKQAHYIAQSNPKACILIVSAELCSLHFYPSEITEEIVANLLFADGAAAVVVCGEKNELAKDRTVLKIDEIGSAFIPNTAEQMTWHISSTAFRMHLSSKVVSAIRENIHRVVKDFVGTEFLQTDYWAIHPGGIKILEAVQEGLGLNDDNIVDSVRVMQQYGNMSSPTILFILDSIFNKIKQKPLTENEKIFACAFGPGLNIEMLRLSSVVTARPLKSNSVMQSHAV